MPAADLARGHQRVMVAPQGDLLVVVDQQLGDLVEQRADRVVEVVEVEVGQGVRELRGERLVQLRAERLDLAELLRLEAGRRRQRVAELHEALGAHRLQHVEVVEQQPLDRDRALERPDRPLRAPRFELVVRLAQLVQDQLEPELVGLVDDDEQQLVVRLRRQRLLELEQVVDPQVAGVLGALLRRVVERAVHECVGLRVPGARDRADRPGVELLELAQGLLVQRRHIRALDLVLAVDLLGDQLGVVDHLDLGGAQLTGALEAEQEAAVLGDVVRRMTERDRRLVEDVAVRRRHDGRRGGRSRIATGSAVHVDDDELQAADSGGKSPATRERRRSRTSR